MGVFRSGAIGTRRIGPVGLVNSLLFEVVREQLCKVFTVIVVVTVYVVEEVDQPVAEVYLVRLAAAHHGVDDGRILCRIVITAE